jgi:hypothetical protein
MYICQSCNTVQLPRTPLSLRVVETRQMTYTNTVFDEDEGEKQVVTKGWETVREERWCPSCVKSMVPVCIGVLTNLSR